MDRLVPPKFTYQDYQTWNDEERRELFDGEIVAMSPGARPLHQRLVTRIGTVLSNKLAGSRCEAFVAPIDVKLSEKDIVQPDVVVVCNPSQITDTCIEGPPTVVIEVLSPSSLRHDRVRKMNLYSKFQIREYWIVTPEPAMIEIFALDSDGAYRVAGTYADTGEFTSTTLPQVTIDLSDLFGPPQEYPDEVRQGTPPSLASRTSS